MEPIPAFIPTMASERVQEMFKTLLNSNKLDCTGEQRSLLSLRCPMTLVRLKEPIRFKFCTHLECIERTSWEAHLLHAGHLLRCPICGKKVSRKEAYIDGFILQILQSVEDAVDTVEITNAQPHGISWKQLLPPSMVGKIVIDLTADDTVYEEPWVQPVCIKPDPGLPNEAKTTEPVRRVKKRVKRPKLSEDDKLVDLT